jgi:hypothetical protein
MVFAAVRSALGSRAVVPSSRATRSIDFPYHFACRRHRLSTPAISESTELPVKVSLDSESPIACLLPFELIFPIILHAGATGCPLLQFLNCLSKVLLDSESPIACLPSELIFPIILHASVVGPPFPHFRDCLSHASVARHIRFRVRTVLRPVVRWNTCSRARRQRAVRLLLGGLNL